MRVCGIDPGGAGAMATIEGLNVVSVFDMERDLGPITGGALSAEAITRELRESAPEMIVIEKQGPQAVTSKKSIFSLGRNYQALLSGIKPYVSEREAVIVLFVTPQAWKRKLGLTAKRGSTSKEKKMLTANMAENMFPGVAKGPRGGTKDGRADALMIAVYGQKVS